MTDGVIVAADQKFEWFIPWWWMNYSMHNIYPVTFINFGNLSPTMIKWCQERGELQDYRHPEGFTIDGKSDNQVVWVKKPFAMLQSPYDRTIWFDLDCFIRGSIGSLFADCENSAGLGIAKEPKKLQSWNLEKGYILEGETIYNAGVIVFKKDSCMMKLWTNELLQRHANYHSDQDTLSRLLCNVKISFTRIDPLYNWMPIEEVKPEAKVYHLISEGYKRYPKVQMMFLKFKMLVNFP